MIALSACCALAGCRVGESHGGRDGPGPIADSGDGGRLDAARDQHLADLTDLTVDQRAGDADAADQGALDQGTRDQGGAEGLLDATVDLATRDTSAGDATVDVTSVDSTVDTVAPDSSVDSATAVVRWVFVTNATFQGDLGGVAGADAKCRAAAIAASLPGATAAGSYKAWLTGADANSAPALRFSRPANAVYKLRDTAGTIVAVGWSGLTTVPLQAAIDVTETGGAVTSGQRCNGDFEAFSNTKADGTQANVTWHCQDWTVGTSPDLGYTGTIGNTNANWTQQCATSCGSSTHLYCFQQ
ncbi:MAG: hypothetical protein KC503_24405 [Myxococcales bacterium]|nr:hypothetical protein [Myxococcales bacterium]